MNRPRKLTALLAFLFLASATVTADAQRPPSTRGNLAELERLMLGLPATSSYVHPGWGIELMPVPDLVRMHCPLLKADQGLVVGRVFRNGLSATVYDLRYGDILLLVGGHEVMGLATLPATPGGDLVVVRAGDEVTLEPRVHSTPKLMRRPRRSARTGTSNGLGTSTRAGSQGVSASSFASGNESVSVVQNGQQMSLKMLLPELHDGPIEFKGTREQIQEQVERSTLSPAAKQRVMKEIR